MYEAVIYEINIGNKYYIGSTKNMRCRKSRYKSNFKIVKDNIDYLKTCCRNREDFFFIDNGLKVFKQKFKTMDLNVNLVMSIIENDFEYKFTPLKTVNVENMTEQRCIEGEMFIQYRECYGVRNIMNVNVKFPDDKNL